jgi:hypothetical protein
MTLFHWLKFKSIQICEMGPNCKAGSNGGRYVRPGDATTSAPGATAARAKVTRRVGGRAIVWPERALAPALEPGRALPPAAGADGR